MVEGLTGGPLRGGPIVAGGMFSRSPERACSPSTEMAFVFASSISSTTVKPSTGVDQRRPASTVAFSFAPSIGAKPTSLRPRYVPRCFAVQSFVTRRYLCPGSGTTTFA
jgi:hypothetical protein